jgi:hypothetical protein
MATVIMAVLSIIKKFGFRRRQIMYILSTPNTIHAAKSNCNEDDRVVNCTSYKSYNTIQIRLLSLTSKSMGSPLRGNSWVVLGSTESHGSGTVFTEYFRLTQSSIIFQFSNFTFIRFKQVLHKIVTC